METVKQYPAWQKAIRAAQAVEEVRIAQQVEADKAEQRQKDTEQAANLKFVLSLVGIEAEPVKNEWRMDGYVFWLAISPHYESPHLSYRNDGTSISFTLLVNKPLPDGTFSASQSSDFTARKRELEGDWTPFQAWIAYQLDELDSDYEAALERQMMKKSAPTGRREMTLDERLADVLRDFILREIRPVED